MIRIPLIDKLIRGKTANVKSNKSLRALSKDIQSMAKDPKWLPYIETINKDGLSKEYEQFFNDEFEKNSQDWEGISKI